ncbi:MAG: HAD family hydrolase [Bdellovibrionales bacterium]|nr:HAD family hydrolase [Bdellovibrionales bacterium]
MGHNYIMRILNSLTHPTNKETLFVFDLDSTIFCVSPRTQQILRDLGAQSEFQEKYPEESKILKEIETKPEDWGIRAALTRSGIRSTLEFFETVRTFWVEHFFSSNYLHLDLPYEGAIEYLHQLDQAGAHLRYLTGRDSERMRKGTLKSFEQWKIPLKSGDDLIMKPRQGLKDEDYKVRYLKTFVGEFKSVYFFENEPLILNKVREDVPEVQLVFMESVHSGKSTAPSGLPTLKMTYL